MKKLYIILLLFVFKSHSQIINFPDPFLKAKLLALGNIDQNGDNEIDIAEAIEVDSLSLNYSSIYDLSGLENFSNLTYLYVVGTAVNDLTPLEGMLGLEVLIGQNNEFTNLAPIMGLPLKKLDFKGNNITNFNITTLAGTLEELICDANPISSLNLNNGNNVLKRISISHTQINQFSYSGTTLQYFGSFGNNLTEIDITGHIGSIQITTPATSLDLSGVTWGSLSLNGLNLSYLNVKNGITTPFSLTYVYAPYLQYLCINDNTNWQSWSINPMVVTNTYCSFTPGGTHYTITGENRIDANGNGCDVSDSFFPSLQYQISDGTTTGSIISNFTGSYALPVTAGTHTITPVLENPVYFSITPSPVTVTFPDQPSPFSQNFCLTPNGTFTDTEILIVSIVPARPGFDTVYNIIYKNKGNTLVSGSVAFNFDDTVLDFVSASAAPSVVNGGDLTWQFTDLMPFETRVISLTLNVNSPIETPAVNIGEILTFNALINGLSEDVIPADNSMTIEQTVVGAYDPNDITCLEGDLVSPEMAGQYVHYVIRFENTGNYPATNVVVKNMIDLTKFDLNTLVPIHSSHDFITRITGNKVEFIFEDIMLPFDDDNNDGYITFKIKTAPYLVVGDTFTQQADIFFDFNHPIETNTAITTISALSTNDYSNAKNVVLYPNPANDVLNLKVSGNVKSYQIVNILGQTLISNDIPEPNPGIDITGLPRGSYFIKISSDYGTSTAKFVKE